MSILTRPKPGAPMQDPPGFRLEQLSLDWPAAPAESLDRLLRESPDAHPLQTPAYVRFAADERRPPFALLAWRGDEPAAAWLASFQSYRRAGVRRFVLTARSPPVFARWLDREAKRGLLLRLVQALRDQRAGARKVVVTAETGAVEEVAPALAAAGFRRQELATFVIDLRPPMEEVLARVDAAARRSAQASVRRGVSVAPATSDAEAAAFAAILAEVLAEGGVPVPPPADYARRLSELSEAMPARLLLARHQGEVVGGTLLVGQGDLALCYQTAVRAKGLRCGDLLMWELLREAKRLGFQQLDLLSVEVDAPAGSRAAGIRSFKAKWGGHLVETPFFVYESPPSALRRLVMGLRAPA